MKNNNNKTKSNKSKKKQQRVIVVKAEGNEAFRSLLGKSGVLKKVKDHTNPNHISDGLPRCVVVLDDEPENIYWFHKHELMFV